MPAALCLTTLTGTDAGDSSRMCCTSKPYHVAYHQSHTISALVTFNKQDPSIKLIGVLTGIRVT